MFRSRTSHSRGNPLGTDGVGRPSVDEGGDQREETSEEQEDLCSCGHSLSACGCGWVGGPPLSGASS